MSGRSFDESAHLNPNRLPTFSETDRQADTSSGTSPPPSFPLPVCPFVCLPVCLVHSIVLLQAKGFLFPSSPPLPKPVGPTHPEGCEVLMVEQVNLFFSCLLLLCEPCPNQSPLTAHWVMFCLERCLCHQSCSEGGADMSWELLLRKETRRSSLGRSPSSC